VQLEHCISQDVDCSANGVVGSVEAFRVSGHSLLKILASG
jgi:hypothetical protein